MAERKRRIQTRKMTRTMRKKLMMMFAVIALVLCGLAGRLLYIQYTSGEKYEKMVLSLQSYDSSTIPYQRGDIVDSTGTVLATSVAVYNVILDCSVMTSDEDYIAPTITALVECFPDLDSNTLYSYATDRADSQYIVLEKKLPYSEIQAFVDLQDAVDEDGDKVNPNIKGVWFELEYERSYPYSTLACSTIGFTSSGNVGTTGLEKYYDDILNGVNGRQYGYLNSDNLFEKTVIEATDGDNIVLSLDANIQMIIEQKLDEFYEAYTDNSTEGGGFSNAAVILMNPNTGEILGMADYPSFDLNNPRDLTAYFTDEEIEAMEDTDISDFLNELWQNYCVTGTYEPGSVQKPFTVAAGLETGLLDTSMTFICDGYEEINGVKVKCSNNSGHGEETLRTALMDSCNDALMQMVNLIGASNFVEYQSIFNFGLKTGIDLPGEANTSTLVYNVNNITAIDLATNSFGQNYNCTMIQMISAFSSLINGGYYYQPHLVTKITDADGNTVSTIEPTLVKQTVSNSTSDLIKEYLYDTVSTGTATMAKVDGYSMGGKTGTAQKLPRGNGQYLVSFIGFAPYENPEVAIYVIVDEPNADNQAHSVFAQSIAREILEEVLPYLNIYPDEEETGRNAGYDITSNGYMLNNYTSETSSETSSDTTATDIPSEETDAIATGTGETAEELQSADTGTDDSVENAEDAEDSVEE